MGKPRCDYFGLNQRESTIAPMARKSLRPQLILPFFVQVKLVRLHIVKNLPQPAGPLDLDGLRLRGLAQPEMGAKIALGKITPAACNLADLRDTAGLNAHAGTHRVTVALRANKFEVEEMIAVSTSVVEQ